MSIYKKTFGRFLNKIRGFGRIWLKLAVQQLTTWPGLQVPRQLHSSPYPLHSEQSSLVEAAEHLPRPGLCLSRVKRVLELKQH
jgi:hypothetical protein